MKNIARFLTGVLLLITLYAPHAAGGERASTPAAPAATLTWEPLLSDVRPRIERSPHYATDHTLYVTTDQDMRRTTDDGDTWTTLFVTTPYSAYLHISSMAWDAGVTTSPTLFVVRNGEPDHGEVFRSTDDGLTWQKVLSPPGTLLYDIAAVRDADDHLVVFAVGSSPEAPAVWRSADGGDTWELANDGLSEWPDLYRVFPSPNFAADHTVYITGYSPPLRSTDGGDTWERVATLWVDIGREVVFSPQYATDGTLWMSYFFVEGSGEEDIPPNGIVRSTDYGKTWEKVNTGLPVEYPDGSILGLGVSPDYPADPSLYAIELTLQYDATRWKLYRSTNRGDTWLAQGLAPAMAPQGMVVAGRDLFFVSTGDGLYRLRHNAWEWLVNGDAELNAGWSFPSTPATAEYSTAQAHGGARSIRLGLVGTTPQVSYSSARQRVTLPAGATPGQLTLWLYPISTGGQQAAFSPAMSAGPAAPSAGDAQFVLIMDDQGNILQRLLWTLDNSQTWKAYTFDLSAYSGRSIWVHCGVYNDGAGGTTGMYVDDVSLTATEPLPASAEPPGNPGVVAEDFLLTDAASYQSVPAVAFNAADDEFLLAYRDSRLHSLPDIYVQRLRSDGRLLGHAVAVTSDDAIQDNARVAYLPAADRYLVIWVDSRNIVDTPDVYGQLVRSDGTLDGGNFPIAVYTGGQVSARVAAGEDAFLVVWGHADGGTSRIQGQRVSGTGALLGARFDISDGTAWAGQPDVAYRPAAQRYLVVWADVRGVDQDIYAQQILADGTLEGDNIAVTNAPNVQEWPVIAAGGVDDAVLVAWEDSRHRTDYTVQRDIYGQRFKPGNTFLGIDIPISTQAEFEAMPTIAVWETAGGSVFFVVWETAVGRGDLHGQRIAANGSLSGAPFVVSDDPYTQSRPAMAVGRTAPQPVVLVVWEDYRVEHPGIYGQRLDGNALHVGLHMGLTPLEGQQVHPVIAYSATADRYLVVWHHVDEAGAHLMAYSVSGDGALAWRPFTITTGIQTPDLALDVAWDALNDRFLVVWSDIRPATVDNFDIFGQIVTLDGVLVNDRFHVSSAPGQQHAPAVAFSPELARYLVIFESVEATDPMTNLYGQFLATDGTPLLTDVAANFPVTTPGADRQARYPDVAYDAAGRSFLAVWQDNRTDPQGWDIYGQRVDGTTGTMLPMALAIAADARHLAERPRLTAGPTGRYFVVWQDTEAVADSDGNVMGQILTANGVPYGAPISVATQDAYHEGAPDVAYHAGSKAFLVVWQGASQGASGFSPDIYARQWSVNGIAVTGGLPIAVDAGSARQWPVIAARDGHAGWLVAWEDGRADPGAERRSVYARRQLALGYIYLPLVMRQK
ncbi:MAG TPA: hypothetical protein PLH19_11310 [Anaerolineae bacterium]|nr:hypothetical protein [Anaerolineae bacterium]HQH39108.1 hypothetical protein [Anaerolineae bacterium]